MIYNALVSSTIPTKGILKNPETKYGSFFIGNTTFGELNDTLKQRINFTFFMELNKTPSYFYRDSYSD